MYLVGLCHMCTQEGPDHHLDPLSVDFHSYEFIVLNCLQCENISKLRRYCLTTQNQDQKMVTHVSATHS